MEKRGPVFVTAFSPLMMILVAIMGSFILAEKIFVGAYVYIYIYIDIYCVVFLSREKFHYVIFFFFLQCAWGNFDSDRIILSTVGKIQGIPRKRR